MLNRKDIGEKIMDYIIMKIYNCVDFTCFPKYIKRRSNVPGRPVISNNSTATKNI